MPIEFGEKLKGLGSLFNSFRKLESKDQALEHLWSKVGEVSKTYMNEKFSEGSELGQLAQSVANSFITTASAALITGAETEGISLIPALLESVMVGVMDWWNEKDPRSNFRQGEWVSVLSGFRKQPSAVEWGEMLMFQDDGDEIEEPIYDVAFFIRVADDRHDCIVFDVKQGKCRTVPLNDCRSIPDQDSLNNNTFLQDLKLLYFQKEGSDDVANTKDEVATGKEVKFQNMMWEVLDFEPVKKMVSIVKDNKIVRTTLDAIEAMDADNQLTWLGRKTTSAFPVTLEKFGYAWKVGASDEELCCIIKLYASKARVIECRTAKIFEVDQKQLHKISDKFKNVMMNVPEFKRFRSHIISGRTASRIWTFRHMCTQSHQNREIDAMDKKAIQTRYDTQVQVFNSVDPDLKAKVKEMELAYNESFDHKDGLLVPVDP